MLRDLPLDWATWPGRSQADPRQRFEKVAGLSFGVCGQDDPALAAHASRLCDSVTKASSPARPRRAEPDQRHDHAKGPAVVQVFGFATAGSRLSTPGIQMHAVCAIEQDLLLEHLHEKKWLGRMLG